MAKVPFTGGKNAESKGKTGNFSGGTGGHTARGVHLPAGSAPGSTSKENVRVGSLKKRMHGAGGTKGFPK